MANIKLKNLIKKINKENAPPEGWGGVRIRPEIINQLHDEYLETYPSFVNPQASSGKPQATNFQASSGKRQALRDKRQASSRKQQAPQ